MAIRKKILNNILLEHDIPSHDILFDEETVLASLTLRDFNFIDEYAIRKRDSVVFLVKEAPAFSKESSIYHEGNRYVGLTLESENESIQLTESNVNDFWFKIKPKFYMLSKLGKFYITQIGKNPKENSYAIVRFPVGDLHGAIPYSRLSPSKELFTEYKNRTITYEDFLIKFNEELGSHRLWEIVQKAKNNTDIYLCCYEEDYKTCHRWAVGERLKMLGATVIYV